MALLLLGATLVLVLVGATLVEPAVVELGALVVTSRVGTKMVVLFSV